MAPRVKAIKYCVIVMMASLFGKILGNIVMAEASVGSILTDLINIGLNTVVGVFLLRDDPDMARIYHCLMTTVCSVCGEQCGSGGAMSCLMPFMIMNALTVVIALLLNNAIPDIISGLKTLFSPQLWQSSYWGFGFMLFFVSYVAVLVAETVGTVFAYKVYKQARDDFSGVQASGGGSWGQGGPGQQARMMRRNDDEESRPAAPAPSRFQPFGGSGQTLGSG